MHSHPTVRDVLAAVQKGEMTLEDAEQEISGLRLEKIGEMALLDTGRAVRCGIPEVILAEGKSPETLATLAIRQARDAGRCVISRVREDQAAAVVERCREEHLSVEAIPSARMVIVSDGTSRPEHGGVVGVITAGTADIPVAEEARVIAEEMGCRVRTSYDVGVAGIHRLFSALQNLKEAHVLVVAAGREGTLPAIVAGLVDRPVIGVPVSTGYGYMGRGQAALASMLQSCALLVVVNIDAGLVAGAFAARIARMVAEHG